MQHINICRTLLCFPLCSSSTFPRFGAEFELFSWFPSAMTLPLFHCSPSACYVQLLAFHFEILVIFLFLLLLPIEVNASARPKIISTNTSLSLKIVMICVNLLCFFCDYKCLLIVVHMLMVIMVMLLIIST
jgi:hypothetical protein